MSENIIDVRNISKSFAGRKVVDGLSLSVAQGEVFGLLGHNGAGKSTTIEKGMLPALEKLLVISNVLFPILAPARHASIPAWPAPTTIISYTINDLPFLFNTCLY